MSRCRVLKTIPIRRSVRVMQLEGLFDVPPAQMSETSFDVEIPFEQRDWQIGLIVGPSGSGKTSILHQLFPSRMKPYHWKAGVSIVDCFPSGMAMSEIAGLLSSVGFSSPPAWLRPYTALSNGEQFRVSVARALAEQGDLVVIDEFTSVVDRGVAKIASAAISKAVRSRQGRLVVASCHFDIVDWLQPDWVFDTTHMRFQWRELQRRPSIELEVVRVAAAAWVVFRHHHYLSHELNRSARCFLGLVEGRPAAFTAVLPFPHKYRSGWREHRTVCLPDFQGVGIGNAMSETIAAVYRSFGKPYFSTTSHPAMIRHRARSPLWKMLVSGSYNHPGGRTRTSEINARHAGFLSRATASFEFVGPARHDLAVGFGLLKEASTCASE